MKKELIIALASAIFGGAATFGFDVIKSKYLKSDDPLAQGVTELTHISKELILEQKSLNNYLSKLAAGAAIPSEIKVEVDEIVSRVNNIIQTTIKFESKSRNVVGIADSVKSRNENAYFNANADIVLAYGRAVTVCGNENTLGVERESGRDAVIYLNGSKRYASVGDEYKFVSPAGPSMVSYLGKNVEQYEFRVVCGTELNRK